MPVERKIVRQAWDAVSESYAANRRADGPDADLIEELLDGLPAGTMVPDVGCGNGARTLRNLVTGTETDAIGLDFSRCGLELARETVPKVRLLYADMTALPVREGAVDAITAYHAVFHVPQVEHLTVYREFERVLRPGGVLLMTVGTARYEGIRRNWLDSGHPMFWGTPGKERSHSQLRDAGFEIAEERTVDDPLGSEALFVFCETGSRRRGGRR